VINLHSPPGINPPKGIRRLRSSLLEINLRSLLEINRPVINLRSRPGINQHSPRVINQHNQAETSPQVINQPKETNRIRPIKHQH
jgi:hypothetical protein